MSDLENKKTEETPKKRPYNLREKKEKKPWKRKKKDDLGYLEEPHRGFRRK